MAFGYLTTTGRVTGRPHRIEIWFALHDGVVYALSGGRGRSDWVRNLIADPNVRFRIGDDERAVTARVIEAGTDEDALARRLLVDKYALHDPDDLKDWGRTALPVAIGWDDTADSASEFRSDYRPAGGGPSSSTP